MASEAADRDAGDPGRGRGQLPRFLLIGVSNFVLGYAVYALSVRLLAGVRIKALVSQLIAYAVGTGWSYFWNRRWTFESRAPVAGEATRFALLQGGCAGMSAGLLGLMVDALGFNADWSWFAVAGLVTVVNFGLSRYWVFRPRRSETTPA